MREFQSTLPRGKRQGRIFIWRFIWTFQSTLPRGKRRTDSKAVTGSDGYFNPRFREGSDPSKLAADLGDYISIHASAREATLNPFPVSVFVVISIHASAREATSARINAANQKRISIHASAREATCPIILSINGIKISIHASAREATPKFTYFF